VKTKQPFELAPGIPIGGGAAPVYIAGPCVLESEEMVRALAAELKQLAARRGVPLIFKTSYDKANRSSLASFRGPGFEQGLEILARLKRELEIPILTDVHEPWQVERAAEVVDVLQVPAFLCRQTDLLLACGGAGVAVNIKKGQFMAPHDMGNAVDKVRAGGCERVTITERGACFGYNNLVVDMRSFPVLQRFAPVVFDVTHSLQLPGGLGHATAGAREFHPHLARAAAAVGVDGFFVETHPDPAHALSDATTQLCLSELEQVVSQTAAITETVRKVIPREP